MIPKFRGKCPDAGWIFGSPVKFDEHICFIMPEFKGATTMSYSVLFDRTAQFVDIETVGRATGLKDKAGLEIYEGDVLLNSKGNWHGEVVYRDGCFRVVPKHTEFRLFPLRAEKMKIVGNIYENPELMEVSE